jgi:hypothetical protein
MSPFAVIEPVVILELVRLSCLPLLSDVSERSSRSVTRDIQNAGSSQMFDQIVCTVRWWLELSSGDMPVVVFAVNEIDGAATVPFPRAMYL